MTRVLPADLDYTARDFDALDARMQSAIDSVFPTWSDKSKANFGNLLRNMLAYVGDVLGYYLDAQAIESRFTTCTRRINGIRHARALNYTFRRQQAATCDVTITLRQAYAGSVTVTQGSIIRTGAGANPYRFQVLSVLVLNPGTVTGVLSTEHSLTWTSTYQSSDLADQSFVLPQTPFLGIVSITDDVGAFSEVSTFLDSESTDAHYLLRVSESDKCAIVFGDGTNGRKPSGTVTIVYKTGGGKIAVEAGALNTPEFSLVDSLGNQVSFSVSNASVSSGGEEKETLAEAQQRAPALIGVNSRCVNDSDYANVARLVTGVSRAMMLTSDLSDTMPENYGQLYLAARGTELSSGAYAPAAPTQAQKDAVEALILASYPKTITFQYDVVDVQFKTIDITARVRLAAGASPATVDALIRSRLADYFAVIDADGNLNDKCQFGIEYLDEQGDPDPRIPWSDLFGVVQQTTGVRSVNEDNFQPYDDVTLAVNEMPKLGAVTLINDRTGDPLV